MGCDRLAANGDAANKIGTSGVAILAQHYHIPFYVFCPSSTIDLACPTGAQIPIEMRDPEEIYRMYFEKPMAPAQVNEMCIRDSHQAPDLPAHHRVQAVHRFVQNQHVRPDTQSQPKSGLLLHCLLYTSRCV